LKGRPEAAIPSLEKLLGAFSVGKRWSITEDAELPRCSFCQAATGGSPLPSPSSQDWSDLNQILTGPLDEDRTGVGTCFLVAVAAFLLGSPVTIILR
jgi:hypothetical protein